MTPSHSRHFSGSAATPSAALLEQIRPYGSRMRPRPRSSSSHSPSSGARGYGHSSLSTTVGTGQLSHGDTSSSILPLALCPDPFASVAQTPRPSMSPLSKLKASLLGAERVLCPRVEVRFETGIVDIVGPSTCTKTGYSLPGQVILTFPSLPSIFEGRYRILHDLTVVFEGKAEYWDHNGRHSPLRLFASALPLVPMDDPLMIPPYDPKSDDPRTITVVLMFDLRLPAWLPPTMTATFTGTGYGVCAASEVGWSAKTSSRSLSPLFSPSLTELQRARSTYSPFIIRRHRMPRALRPTATIRDRSCNVTAWSSQLERFVNLVVTVPEWIDIHDQDVAISIRFIVGESGVESNTVEAPANSKIEGDGQERAAGSIESDVGVHPSNVDSVSNATSYATDSPSPSKKRRREHLTHIVELGMEVEEIGKFSSQPFDSFTNLVPIPAEQPDGEQYRLMGPSLRPDISALTSFINIDSSEPIRTTLNRRCLLTPEGEQRSYRFPGEGQKIGTRWTRVKFVLPLPYPDSPGNVWRPNPDTDGPFLRLRHALVVRIALQAPGFDEPEFIHIQTPLRFGTSPEQLAKRAGGAPCLAPPPYITVFHENGELRDCDPLPIYPGPPECATFAPDVPQGEPLLQTGILAPSPRLSWLPGPEPYEPMDVDAPESSLGTSTMSRESSPNATPLAHVIKLPGTEWSRREDVNRREEVNRA